MKLIDAAAVLRSTTVHLGLPNDVPIGSDAWIATALRRAAGLLCPTTTSTLVRAVADPIRGILPELERLAERAGRVAELLLAHGDLVEAPDVDGFTPKGRRLVFCAPPAFMVRESGAVVLLGIADEAISPLPEEIQDTISYRGILRVIEAPPTDARAYFGSFGLIEVTESGWLRSPARSSASSFRSLFDMALEEAKGATEVAGLQVIDSDTSTTHYRTRWKLPTRQTGRYVGRRQQTYGADLWCYVRLDNGQATHLLDLPVFPDTSRGVDVAWRLQAAIDAVRGAPQRFSILSDEDIRDSRLSFYSPVPSWLVRRLDLLGTPADPQGGALLTYLLPRREAAQEAAFAADMMWLEQNPAK